MRRPQSTGMLTRRASWRVWSIGVVALVAAAATIRVMLPPPDYLVGAYYYGWYDAEHRQALDYLGPHLPEPLEPSLGEYQSDDPDVVATHVQWASEFGIDYLILSFSGQGRTADRQARNLLLPAPVNSPVRQAPVIELLSYNDLDLSHPDLWRRLIEDVRYVGEHYLRHPSVMRVNGRPLLFLYVTRVLKGDVNGWVAEIRRELAGMGVNPFIVADQVFWEDIAADRLKTFDAVTAYNTYDWPLTQHRGWASQSTFFEDVDQLYTRWRETANRLGVAFVPNAMPGFNDRGVRLEEDHFVVPRSTRPGGSKTGFFEQSIELAKRHVDPELRMVTITSFNEWHEWTQIEPARAAPLRSPDGDPEAYTQGFPHPLYEFEYLEQVRKRLGPVEQ